MSSTSPLQTPASRTRFSFSTWLPRPLETRFSAETWVIGIALFTALVGRCLIGWGAPFWIDEAYTGTIASQGTFAGLLDWCRHELSGPAYYGLIWVWEKFAGSSDLALRLPSFLLIFAAVGAILALPLPDRRVKWIWAALIALWPNGLGYAAQARPQALLLLLAVLQAVSFLRCLERPDMRRLAVWSAVGATMLLTHLHATVIIGLQFLLLAHAYRLELARYCAAFAPFLVPAVWLPYQLSFVLRFLQPGVAEYRVLTIEDLPSLPVHLFGADTASVPITVALTLAVAYRILHRTDGKSEPLLLRPEAALTLSGVGAVAFAVGVGMVRPSFDTRYLLPYMPAVLYGAAAVLARSTLIKGRLPMLVIGIWALVAGSMAVENLDEKSVRKANEYEFQRASEWLMLHHQRRIVFVWANSTAKANDARLQSEMAGFFFRRANYDAQIKAVYLDRSQQNSAGLAALARREGAAIIWVDAFKRAWMMPTAAGHRCVRFGPRRGGSMACLADQPA